MYQINSVIQEKSEYNDEERELYCIVDSKGLTRGGYYKTINGARLALQKLMSEEV